MKNGMMRTLGLSMSLAMAGAAFAGDGHDHGVPGAVAAPKGGAIKPAHGSYFELLQSGNTLKVYTYDEKVKPMAPSTLKDVEAMAKLPKGKPEKLALKVNADHFEMTFDPKKNHRFELTMKFKVKGEADSVTYNVEKN